MFGRFHPKTFLPRPQCSMNKTKPRRNGAIRLGHIRYLVSFRRVIPRFGIAARACSTKPYLTIRFAVPHGAYLELTRWLSGACRLKIGVIAPYANFMAIRVLLIVVISALTDLDRLKSIVSIRGVNKR